jgi:hypothetical protein
MKVLAVIGSPRTRGNSFKVTQPVEHYLKSFGDVDFEYLFLSYNNMQRNLIYGIKCRAENNAISAMVAGK